MKEIIFQINEALKNQGISQTEIAKRIGAEQKTVNRLLSGKTQKPDIRLIDKLRQTLGMVAASPPVPAVGQADSCGSCSGRQSHYIEKVAQMMQEMDEDTQKDICLSVEKEKLLRELMKERQERGAA